MTASRWPISADWCQIHSLGWPRMSRRTWRASWSQLLPGKMTRPTFACPEPGRRVSGATRYPITSRPEHKGGPLVEAADALRLRTGAGNGIGHAGGEEGAGGGGRRAAAGATLELDADFDFHLPEAQAGVDQDSHKGQKGARHRQLGPARHRLKGPGAPPGASARGAG